MRVCRDWRAVAKVANREAWAIRVAMNLANSHYRRRAAEKRARDRLTATVGPSTKDHDWAAGVAVREALAELPSRQRAVLIMRFYADLPFAEIADALGTGESTVKSLARRGLQRLRDDPRVPGVEGVRFV